MVSSLFPGPCSEGQNSNSDCPVRSPAEREGRVRILHQRADDMAGREGADVGIMSRTAAGLRQGHACHSQTQGQWEDKPHCYWSCTVIHAVSVRASLSLTYHSKPRQILCYFVFFFIKEVAWTVILFIQFEYWTLYCSNVKGGAVAQSVTAKLLALGYCFEDWQFETAKERKRTRNWFFFSLFYGGRGSSVGRARDSWWGGPGFDSRCGRPLPTGWVGVSIMWPAETEVMVSQLCLNMWQHVKLSDALSWGPSAI